MKNPTIKKAVLCLSLFMATAAIPHLASAAPSVRIQLPSISIGVNDRNNQNRYYDNRYRNNQYRNNRYNNNRNTQRNSYRSTRTYRSYNKPYIRSYNNSYNRSYDNQQSRRVYAPSYQSSICPTPGYSQNYYEGHGCYQHKDHYHCE